MRGFLAILENMFRKFMDWKSFWFFLALTLLSTGVPFLFSFEEYEAEKKKLQAGRNLISRTITDFPLVTLGEELKLTKLSSENKSVGGQTEDIFSLNARYTVQSQRSLLLSIYRLKPERFRKFGSDYGINNLTCSAIDYDITLGKESEQVSLTPSDIKKLKSLEELKGPKFPDRFLSKIKNEKIRKWLESDDWRSIEKKKVQISFDLSYRLDPEKFVGTKVSFLGSSTTKGYNISKIDFVYRTQQILLDYLVGFGGVFFAVLITSGIIPGMFEEGQAELLFSRGTPRWIVFLGHYVGAALFYGLLAFVFLFFTGLFFWINTGVQSLYLVVFVFPMLLLFFVVFSMAALIGVVLEDGFVSIIGSIIGSFLGWVFLFGIRMLSISGLSEYLPEVLRGIVDGLSTILPSTGEVKVLIWRLIPKFIEISPVLKNSVGDSPESTFSILGSSFGFVLVFFGISIFLLNQKEL